MQVEKQILDAAKTALTSCMGLKQDEKLLIVTDDGKIDVAYAFSAAGRALGAQTVLMEMAAQKGGEPPESVAQALLAADVALLITSGSLTHTNARSSANEKGVRIASMPMLTDEVVTTVLAADYDKVESLSTKLAGLLSEAKEIKVTTAAGTDLTLHCDGRGGIADTGKLLETGAFGNLPAGEAMVAPLEGKGEGKLVVDGVVAGFQDLKGILTIDMKDGVITNVAGEDAADFADWRKAFDDSSGKIAEFGIGTNDRATIIGNPLVDEKVFGTIHVAFGNNLFMGGAQPGNIHYDCIIRNPTVYLDGTCIIKDGKHIH